MKGGSFLWGIIRDLRWGFPNTTPQDILFWECYVMLHYKKPPPREGKQKVRGLRWTAHTGPFSIWLCSLRKQRRRHHPAVHQHRSSHTGLTLFSTCLCDALRRAPIKIPEKYVRNDVFVQFISALIWFLEKAWHDVTIVACHKWSHGASMRAPPAPR